MIVVVVWLGVWVFGGGCSTLHVPTRSVPGEADPKSTAPGAVAGWQERPADPGFEGVVVTGESSLSLFDWKLSTPTRKVVRSAGVGVTVERIASEMSPMGLEDADSLMALGSYNVFGAHVGYEPLEFGPGVEGVRSGALVVEGLVGRRWFPGTFRVGVEYAPVSQAVGPRFTLETLRAGYVSTTYLGGEGWSMEMGVNVRWSFGWVWGG